MAVQCLAEWLRVPVPQLLRIVILLTQPLNEARRDAFRGRGADFARRTEAPRLSRKVWIKLSTTRNSANSGGLSGRYVAGK